MTTSFDPSAVDLSSADPASIICYLASASQASHSDNISARIAALVAILLTSTAATSFPVLAQRWRLRGQRRGGGDGDGDGDGGGLPLYVLLFARHFGAGVILATAFIHLLDPAYAAIGPQTCVGLTGGWALYSWCPAIVLVALVSTFLLDLAAQRYVEVVYGDEGKEVESMVVVGGSGKDDSTNVKRAATQDIEFNDGQDSVAQERLFKQQIAAFLVLEVGVIFHSVIIGLTLGTVGEEFGVLFPVIVFHQSFEGLGIGARMSTIPFKRGSWLPWILCLAYGLTTPIALAVGLGVRNTYDRGSFTANVVSGVLNSISAGILTYTALVELLARDFLFDPLRTKDNVRLTFMIVSLLLGAALMALLGKWA